MTKAELGLLIVALLVLAAAAGFAARYFVARGHPQPPRIESRISEPPAPKGPVDSALKDMHGHPHKLSEWRGDVVLLNFWATWCPPCRREIPMLARLQTKYGQQGLQVVGIATDETNPAAVRAFIKKMNFTYPVLWGHGRAVDIARRLGVNLVGLPYTIVIDRHGNVVEKHAGELDAELAHRLVQENLAGAK